MPYRLRLMPGQVAICRLPPDTDVPPWVGGEGLVLVLRTARELTIACRREQVPKQVRCASGWHVLELEQTFAFDAVGVLHAVLTPLKECAIPALAFSGYSTDYILVRAVQRAIDVLREAGHTVC